LIPDAVTQRIPSIGRDTRTSERARDGADRDDLAPADAVFDDAVSDEAYQQAPYSSRGSRDTRNAADMVYTSDGNSGAQLLANVSRAGSGYRATFAIGIQLS
jgi:hypothetical protein